ncbi:MAG: KAP family P-loop NTPase fold protein [Thermomicrobiales bacterium]
MWSDNEANIDLLRFGYLAKAVTGVVMNTELLPITVGIYGDWGGGKSSLIRLVQADLASKPNVMTLQFNGWLFEGYEDAKTALMGTILDAIKERTESDQTLSERGKGLLTKLMRRVNWLQAARMAGRYLGPAVVGLPHLSLMNAGTDIINLVRKVAAGDGEIDMEEAKKLLAETPDDEATARRNVREFRDDFAALLADSKIDTLVVFIDDLDRCLPDTIIETLEAIKLFLFVKGTAFVIGADERLIQYAVRQRFPELPGTAVEVGRDYLEKLIQVPIRIPPLGAADIESYMNLLFAERQLSRDQYTLVCQQVAVFTPNNVTDRAFDVVRARAFLPEGNIPANLQHDFDLTAQIVPVLMPGLNGNPRRAKRFLNSLLLRLTMGADRGLTLERRVLAKLMMLEYIRPMFFRDLAALQGAEGGRPHALAGVERVLRMQMAQPAPHAPAYDSEMETPSANGKDATKTPRRALHATAPAPDAASREVTAALPEETLPAPIQPWLADDWMRRWLVGEPFLSDVDLRPYFYIAHDQVGPFADLASRLTPAAADVLNRLLDPGEATQQLGLRRAADLNSPDALSVFQALAQRVRQAEVLDERSPQGVLFKLTEARQELLPQLISLYGGLPEVKFTAAVPMALVRLTKDTTSEQACRSIVERWSRSAHTILARAARGALGRQQSPTRPQRG